MNENTDYNKNHALVTVEDNYNGTFIAAEAWLGSGAAGIIAALAPTLTTLDPFAYGPEVLAAVAAKTVSALSNPDAHLKLIVAPSNKRQYTKRIVITREQYDTSKMSMEIRNIAGKGKTYIHTVIEAYELAADLAANDGDQEAAERYTGEAFIALMATEAVAVAA